jgi:hypothetical protein
MGLLSWIGKKHRKGDVYLNQHVYLWHQYFTKIWVLEEIKEKDRGLAQEPPNVFRWGSWISFCTSMQVFPLKVWAILLTLLLL